MSISATEQFSEDAISFLIVQSQLAEVKKSTKVVLGMAAKQKNDPKGS